ncbi:MAG: SufS family cysteine desulfurase [Bacteroidales bacterium]|nr:SufS family cysteine desulfurase [Bacteroidales bacterium]
MDARRFFPALDRQIYGKPLVYFDNAATAQRPQAVLDLQQRLCVEADGNVHRAVHKLGADATDFYEAGREAVRRHLNAPARENIIFTSGTTASINLVATCFCQRFVGSGDRILVSEAEHHSNIVPWQLACGRCGASLEVLPVDEAGELSVAELEQRLAKAEGRIKLLAVAHISNVLGIVNPVREIIETAHRYGVPVLLDGAQGIVHGPVDVQLLDCDFYAFSGHKIYAPTGIGILYGKTRWLVEMPPYMGGGEMIETVRFEKTTYAPLPLKFEAGTPNFVAAACFVPALEMARTLAEDAQVQENQRAMRDYLLEELPRIDGLRIFGLPREREQKIPLFSFTVEGAFPSDLAQILDKMGIAVRSGQMCAEPLLRRFGQTAMLRVSLAPYNTLAECEFFVAALRRAVKMLR